MISLLYLFALQDLQTIMFEKSETKRAKRKSKAQRSRGRTSVVATEVDFDDLEKKL